MGKRSRRIRHVPLPRILPFQASSNSYKSQGYSQKSPSRATTGQFIGRYRLLPQGWDLRRTWGAPRHQTKLQGDVGIRHLVRRVRKPRRNTKRVPRNLLPISRTPPLFTTTTRSTFGWRPWPRMVGGSERNWKESDSVGTVSESLRKGAEQVVGRVSRRGSGCHRRMVTKERMHRFIPKGMGGPIPVPSSNQGRISQENQAFQNHRSFQLRTGAMFPERRRLGANAPSVHSCSFSFYFS